MQPHLSTSRLRCSLALVVLTACWTATTRLAAGEEAYPAVVKVTPLLRTTTDNAGQPLVYPRDGSAEVTALLVEIPAGAQTAWHHHTVPCFAYMLEGELQVETRGRGVRTLKAGEAFAEVVDLLHNGRNKTERPARLVMFVVGTEGKRFTVPASGVEK
ncbi:cupin domain-containing protein [Opitutus sp. ER46]|uniref:cupin domain-containing protein n=1 Tax=Opitutus sp. ER46 TaxID=2161864 RepID=UPI000D324777|nr:cupin domain-containing protein [Opitutus sp. ER46]PTX94575.1 cupin domain-containing protein [Opitutus sp. ER46]